MFIITQRSVYLVDDQSKVHKLDPATGQSTHLGSVPQSMAQEMAVGDRFFFDDLDGKSVTRTGTVIVIIQ